MPLDTRHRAVYNKRGMTTGTRVCEHASSASSTSTARTQAQRAEHDEDVFERQVAAKNLDARENLDAMDLSIRIGTALRTLPEEQREVFLLRTEADMPFKKIASLQKTSINTALARMQYALAKLREALQRDYEELTRE
mgnify:CR=1 FL=1